MRRLPVLILALGVVGCSGSLPAVERPGEAQDASWRQRHVLPESPAHRNAVENQTRTPEGAPGPQHWTQYADYTLHARIRPEDHVLEGDGQIVYRNRSPHDLYSLYLELSLNLHAPGVVRNQAVTPTEATRLRRIAVDGVELKSGGSSGPRYEVEGTRLLIIPPGPVSSGGEVTIELEWAFDIPAYGAGGRMGRDGDELYFLAYWYPTMSVYDDVEGWFNDPFRGNAEFYHGFGDYDVTIEVPQQWVVHATGALANESDVLIPDVLQRLELARDTDTVVRVLDASELDGGGTPGEGNAVQRWRFIAEGVPDFSFSASRNSIWDAARVPIGDRDGDGAVDHALMSAVYRPDASLWRNVAEYGQHALSYFSESTGIPYPWPHMTAVEGTPIETGGMEYPMMTLIGNYNTRGDSALYAVVAHELAHQWIPMMVSPNERRYGWIDEGLTTFAENAAKHERNPQGMHRLSEMLQYILVAHRGIESEIMTWSDYHTNSTSEVTAVYYKPATVFEALKGVIGDETFDEAYRTFLREWTYRHPYPADLFATFERVSGLDLDWFWRSWFYETWHLDQGIKEVVERESEIVVEVVNVGLIPMPVRLEVELEDGDLVHRSFDAVSLWGDGAVRASLRVPVSQPVVRVEIDPEMRFPDVERSNNVWWTDAAP